MVDISHDARWGRVMEGAGEDPYLASQIGVARIRGFQGDDLSANNTIAACAKHFAGCGFAEAGKDYNTGRPSDKDGNVFWSHYIDEANTPLYPFGYGLSYTQFNYTEFKVDDSDQSAIKVSVMVKNVGDTSGEEVTQLYIQDKTASVVRPVKELKGFRKFKLQLGETQEIRFVLTEKELGFYDNDGSFTVEPGIFDVMVGTNSAEVLKKSFELF